MPQLPRVNLIGSVFLTSLVVVVIGYSVVMSLAVTFAERGGYEIDPNQVLGLVNFMFS